MYRIVLLFQEEVTKKNELPLKLFENFGTVFCGVLQAADYTGSVSYQYMAFLRIITATLHLILTELTEAVIYYFEMPAEKAEKWKT